MFDAFENIPVIDTATGDTISQNAAEHLLIMRLFEVMSADLSVMAEHDDSDESLMHELKTCGMDILMEYAETFGVDID